MYIHWVYHMPLLLLCSYSVTIEFMKKTGLKNQSGDPVCTSIQGDI